MPKHAHSKYLPLEPYWTLLHNNLIYWLNVCVREIKHVFVNTAVHLSEQSFSKLTDWLSRFGIFHWNNTLECPPNSCWFLDELYLEQNISMSLKKIVTFLASLHEYWKALRLQKNWRRKYSLKEWNSFCPSVSLWITWWQFILNVSYFCLCENFSIKYLSFLSNKH